MLIDFDYAASMTQESKIGQRTVRSPSMLMYALIPNVTSQGTPPFMAIALLLDVDTDGLHHAKYDLESLMYVFFYCGTMLKGPKYRWRDEADFKAYTSIPMREWFDLRGLESSYAKMGRTKISHMAVFENTIIDRMDKYFSPLFQGFRQLKEAVFPPGESYTKSPINHQRMIEVFNDILANLPAEHTTMRGIKRSQPTDPSEYLSSHKVWRLNAALYQLSDYISLCYCLLWLSLLSCSSPSLWYLLFSLFISVVTKSTPLRQHFHLIFL
jgi:hypothetical protein